MGEKWSFNQIFEEIQDEGGIETKTFSETARNIMGCMGILSGALKNTKGRYEFGEKGHAFWKEALANYSKEPYASIRSRKYKKVPLSVIREFMDMVVEAMEMARKTSYEIQQALLNIDNTVGYSARLSEERLRSIVIKSSQRYFDKILKKVEELAEYINDTRLSEVQDSALNMDPATTEKMIAAISVMIESEGEDDSCSEDSDSIIKPSKKADISAQIADKSKSNEEKKKKWQAISNKLNISPEEQYVYYFVKYRPAKEVFEEALQEIDKEALTLQKFQKYPKPKRLKKSKKSKKAKRSKKH